MQRANSSVLDSYIHNDVFFNVLDHGAVRVIDYMGNDSAIVDAARISYGKGTTQKSTETGLINYLMRHKHTSPFEMCELKLYVKLPIFIARQWIRHRTANVNEYSARYSILSKEFYIPSREVLAAQSRTNKQGRGEAISDREADCVLQALKNDANRTYSTYQLLLNEYDNGQPINEENVGIARELARMNLTLNHYTEWVWKIDLHNLLHFLALRMDSHAQYEIRQYANVIADIVKAWCPLAYEAFEEYRLEAVTYSRKEQDFVVRMAQPGGYALPIEPPSNFSKGEWREFLTKIKRDN